MESGSNQGSKNLQSLNEPPPVQWSTRPRFSVYETPSLAPIEYQVWKAPYNGLPKLCKNKTHGLSLDENLIGTTLPIEHDHSHLNYIDEPKQLIEYSSDETSLALDLNLVSRSKKQNAGDPYAIRRNKDKTKRVADQNIRFGHIQQAIEMENENNIGSSNVKILNYESQGHLIKNEKSFFLDKATPILHAQKNQAANGVEMSILKTPSMFQTGLEQQNQNTLLMLREFMPIGHTKGVNFLEDKNGESSTKMTVLASNNDEMPSTELTLSINTRI